jgi:hypothetical protein
VNFPEEKAQPSPAGTKSLLFLAVSHHPGYGRDLSVGASNKSLLVLFFRKEHLSSLTFFRVRPRRLGCLHKPPALKKIYLKLGKLGN